MLGSERRVRPNADSFCQVSGIFLIELVCFLEK